MIDADALKELFSEVIGHIAKKPEMNGNLEHMIRASAMVIQMIDDAPTVHPDTTTHDSISAKTGKNDGDRTSGDCISRTQAIDALKELTANGTNKGMVFGEDAVHRIEMLPSAQPEIIRCKDCKYRDKNWRRVSVKWLPCMDVQTSGNWYCGSAEREEQE